MATLKLYKYICMHTTYGNNKFQCSRERKKETTHTHSHLRDWLGRRRFFFSFQRVFCHTLTTKQAEIHTRNGECAREILRSLSGIRSLAPCAPPKHDLLILFFSAHERALKCECLFCFMFIFFFVFASLLLGGRCAGIEPRCGNDGKNRPHCDTFSRTHTHTHVRA